MSLGGARSGFIGLRDRIDDFPGDGRNADSRLVLTKPSCTPANEEPLSPARWPR